MIKKKGFRILIGVLIILFSWWVSGKGVPPSERFFDFLFLSVMFFIIFESFRMAYELNKEINEEMKFDLRLLELLERDEKK